jgi:dihydroorotate dehydrogenase
MFFLGAVSLAVGPSPRLQPPPNTAKTSRVPDLSVSIAGLKLSNPTMTCSGTCGYAFEYADFMDLSRLGAFVTKSITREERKGNEPARVVETRAGMLNAIGLANVGLQRFLHEKVPQLRKMPCPVIVNVAGHSFDDYAETCAGWILSTASPPSSSTSRART